MIEYAQIQTFIIVLFMLITGVTSIVSLILKINEIRKVTPSQKNKEELERLNYRVSKLEDKVSNFSDFKSNQSSFNSVIAKAILAMLSHEINGNSIDKLKNAQEELQTYLTRK